MKRLGLDYVDIFHHHRPDHETPMEESLGALNLMVQQGKALYVGVSSYSGEQYSKAVEIVKQNHWVPITIHHPYYNIRSSGIETDLLRYTKMSGTGVIAFCLLAGGDLTDRYLHGLPPDSRQGKRGADGERWWQEQKERGVWDRLGHLNAIAQQRGQTLTQMALAWVVRLPTVTSALTRNWP